MNYLKQNYILLIIIGLLVILVLLLMSLTIAGRRRQHNFTDATQSNAISYSRPAPNIPNVPAHYPYMTGSQPVASATPDMRLQEQQQGQYGPQPGQLRISQANWLQPPKEQDVIPTQPLRKNTQEHNATLPYEP